MRYKENYVTYLIVACIVMIASIVGAGIYNFNAEENEPVDKPRQIDRVMDDIEDAAQDLQSAPTFSQDDYITVADTISRSSQDGDSSSRKRRSSSSSSGGGGGGGGSSSSESSSGNEAQSGEVQQPTAPPVENPQVNSSVSASVCNLNLIGGFGLDNSNIIDSAACTSLNSLYAEGKAAGNAGDVYYNRDNNHVSLCYGWTPNPDCPEANRLFPQHNWLISGEGRMTSPLNAVTVGQASYAGTNGHGIAYTYYENQQNAQQAYDLYTSNNLFIYPSLDDDTFVGDKGGVDALINQIWDPSRANIANTPYIISSKQIIKPGTTDYRVHEASSSEMPFVKLALAGLAAFKPEVKQRLKQGVNAEGDEVTFLIPTVQMLLRYSHNSINSNQDYLNSPIVHQGSYMAHVFKDNRPQPAYRASKIVAMANEMSVEDIPPLVRMRVVTETFSSSEKLFDTPGAIARSAPYNSPRMIVVNAQDSFDITGSGSNMEYEWRVSNSSLANVIVNLDNPAEATIEFLPASSTQRVDVFVFVKKSGGKYYSVPGVVSSYMHA